MRLIKVYAVRTSSFEEKWLNEEAIQVVTKTSLTLPGTNEHIPFALYLKTNEPFECYLNLAKEIEITEFKEFIKRECKGLAK